MEVRRIAARDPSRLRELTAPGGKRGLGRRLLAGAGALAIGAIQLLSTQPASAEDRPPFYDDNGFIRFTFTTSAGAEVTCEIIGFSSLRTDTHDAFGRTTNGSDDPNCRGTPYVGLAYTDPRTGEGEFFQASAEGAPTVLLQAFDAGNDLTALHQIVYPACNCASPIFTTTPK